MFTQSMYTPIAAGHYVRRANGWNRVPAEVTTKIFEWNTDAALYNKDGPLKGYMYNKRAEVLIEGERFVYEVRMCWGTPEVHFAKIHFTDGSWGEVRNTARPRDEGFWHAEAGLFSRFAEE